MKRKIGFITAFIILAAIGALLLASHGHPSRTIPGRICRFALGSPAARQWMEDLSSDVRSIKQPERLRDWAEDMMAKYRLGALATNTATSYWARGRVKVTNSLIPAWIPPEWHDKMFGLDPEVTICVDQGGKPLFLDYGWYLKGVIIMGKEMKPVGLSTFCIEEPIKGVFTYALEK